MIGKQGYSHLSRILTDAANWVIAELECLRQESLMQQLRQELLEAQKARLELMRWKLLLTSVLGATGLGLTNSRIAPNLELVLACIPFVCVYSDLLCYHQGLVIGVIGKFMRSQAELAVGDMKPLADYEVFAWSVRHLEKPGERPISAYDLERLVLFGSSLVFSSAVIIYGLIRINNPVAFLLVTAGVLGILATIWIEQAYRRRRRRIRQLHKESSA